jgi:hypothetical protein
MAGPIPIEQLKRLARHTEATRRGEVGGLRSCGRSWGRNWGGNCG